MLDSAGAAFLWLLLLNYTAGKVQFYIMDWEKIYREKMLPTEEAAALIDSGDVIFIGCSGNLALALVDAICARQDLTGLRMVGSTNGDDFFAVTDESCFSRVSYATVFLGSSERRNYGKGNIQVNSIHYHNFYRAMRDVYKVNTLIVECSEPDEEGYLYYGSRGVCWSKVDELACKIILQVNPRQQRVLGSHTKIHVSRVTALCYCDHPVRPYESKPVTEKDKRIAQHILPYIKDGDVLQIGIGSIPNSIAYELRDRKNLGIYSEVLTESLLELMRRGAVNLDNVRASFALPSNGLIDGHLLPYVKLAPIDEINNPFNIAQIKNFVSINSCFMADLTGQVCSENYGAGQYSGIGGQVDFARGAAEAEGGRSFLVFASTHRDKAGNVTSNVCLDLPLGTAVTAQRCDVMYLVTEWGLADVFNKPLEERAYAMINIAHPDFRRELYDQACSSGLIRPSAQDIGKVCLESKFLEGRP